MNTQRDINMTFISSKGFDISTAAGLQNALSWIRTTDADNLMYGEPTGEMCRSMLIAYLEAAIQRGEAI